jgi:hypothetical protein
VILGLPSNEPKNNKPGVRSSIAKKVTIQMPFGNLCGPLA